MIGGGIAGSLGFIAHGIGLGVAAILPLGPMKILCLRRTMAYGPSAGVVTAAGVVSGDTIFIIIAALGLTAIAEVLQAAALVLRLIGGLALIYLAVSAFRRHVPTTEPQLGRSRLMSMYAGTVGLTLSNPSTIIGFTTILMSAGGLEAIGGAGGGLTALGMVLGSVLVWIVFTTVAVVAGRFVSAARLVWLNRIAGAMFLYFAAGTLWSVLGPWLLK